MYASAKKASKRSKKDKSKSSKKVCAFIYLFIHFLFSLQLIIITLITFFRHSFYLLVCVHFLFSTQYQCLTTSHTHTHTHTHTHKQNILVRF